MSVISNFLGLNPSGPTAVEKKTPASLGRLSLAELSKRIKDLQTVSNLSGKITSAKTTPAQRLAGTEPDPLGKELGLDLSFNRTKGSTTGLGGRTPEEQAALSKKSIAGRISTLGTQRRKLISRVTGQRTQRASQISTLLGRGI